MKNPLEYVEIITQDLRDQIVTETPTVYEDYYIERVYEFADGAIVSYEWRDFPTEKTSEDEKFNHRFSLKKLPTANKNKFTLGVIKSIPYKSGRR
jgi:hypothetical protein